MCLKVISLTKDFRISSRQEFFYYALKSINVIISWSDDIG